MIRFSNIINKWKAVAFATAVATASYWFSPPDIIYLVSGELINFFGFVIAAVLPAMALTATSLRGSGMSIKRLLKLRDALHRQMNFWAGLVIVSFLAVAFVVVLKPIVACGAAGDCKAIVFYENNWIAINSRLFNGCLGYIFGVVFFQLSNVLRGLQALLRVNAEAAIGEAQQRYDDQMASTEIGVANIRNPPEFGSMVNLPTEPRI